MQNPRILRFLIENSNDETIKKHAKEKLKFTPLTAQEKSMYQGIVNYKHIPGTGGFGEEIIAEAEDKIQTGGNYTVHNPEFLTGANISICLTKEFMEAVENDRRARWRVSRKVYPPPDGPRARQVCLQRAASRLRKPYQAECSREQSRWPREEAVRLRFHRARVACKTALKLCRLRVCLRSRSVSGAARGSSRPTERQGMHRDEDRRAPDLS